MWWKNWEMEEEMENMGFNLLWQRSCFSDVVPVFVLDGGWDRLPDSLSKKMIWISMSFQSLLLLRTMIWYSFCISIHVLDKIASPACWCRLTCRHICSCGSCCTKGWRWRMIDADRETVLTSFSPFSLKMRNFESFSPGMFGSWRKEKKSPFSLRFISLWLTSKFFALNPVS